MITNKKKEIQVYAHWKYYSNPQEISTVVKDWKKIAAGYKISNAEQERMSAAFI